MKMKIVINFLVMFSFFSAITSCSILHQKITITGKALNDKDGAIIETENRDYLINKCDEWDEKLYEKRVTVSGYLVVRTYKKRSTPSVQVQERVGKVYIIKKAKWKLEE